MNNFKKYAFVVFFISSYNLDGQAINDSVFSQLSQEQIVIAKNALADSGSSDQSIEQLPVIDESLVKKQSSDDANNIAGQKYGYDFFLSMPTSLSAVGDLPLPNDYKISLRDQFRVILSGSKDSIFNLNVKLDGTILFPELGSISVVDLTFQEVKEKLTQLIDQSYIGVTIDISLQNLSAKKITIVGAVNTPGTYLVNPFSTITGALAYSGGISEIGSLRDIKLIRNNKEIFSFDLYDLLIKGDRSNDLTIEAGDTILINAAKQFVEIKGGVKRPAIYEVLENETIENLVDFALGFKQDANKTNISVSFLDLQEAAIIKKNINKLDQGLTNALSVDVFSYVNEKTADIQVSGAIEQPGFYDIEKYKYLKDLIDDLQFVDVYPWLAVLEQFDENKIIKSTILFNLNDQNTYNSVELLPNSRIYFANINNRSFEVSTISKNQIADYELRLNHKQIEYRLPVFGKYSIKSFIDLLGLDMTDIETQATYTSPIEDLVINDDYNSMQFIAKKYNTVTFKSPENNLISVTIKGAIEFPGTYVLNDNSTVSDLYQLVGGFKKQALLEGIILTRQIIRNRQIKAIEKSKNDLNQALLLSGNQNMMETDLLRVLTETFEPENLGRLAGDFSPMSKSIANTILFDGDTIIVPKNPNSINVVGEVLNPIAFEFKDNLTVRNAIQSAGGYQQFADERRVYVIKSIGIVVRPKRNIFAGNINLQPGDTIVVPRKITTNNPAMAALIPISELLSNIAFSAAAIENLSNN